MSQAELTVAELHDGDRRIGAALQGLRRRVRLFVVLEGASLLAIWIALTFWVGFGLDYLPVLAGANEMPRLARGLLLATICGGIGYVLYRWLLVRLMIPLSDRSLALLLERRHAGFRDSLVTTVERLSRRPDSDTTTQHMLATTRQQAISQLGTARLAQVFNTQNLLRRLGLAFLLIGTIVAAYATNAGATTKIAARLYGLNDSPWDRFAHIELLCIESRRELQSAGDSSPQTLLFSGQSLKVARGANLTLRVEADANALVVPEQCYLHYRTAEGDQGTITVKRVGRPKHQRQLYVCDAKPLAAILSSLEFDVVGYDHRLSGYRVEVVDSPMVIGATMDLHYPAYMVDELKAIRLPREGEQLLAAGNPLPRGTRANLHFTSSKPLRSATVRVLDPEATEADQLEIERRVVEFSGSNTAIVLDFEIASLNANRALEVTLLDTDGVTSERPFRSFFSAVADEPPSWQLSLEGIGTAVTPDVVLPIFGKVADDYGTAQVWLETAIGTEGSRRFPISLFKGSEVTYAIDFRELAKASEPLKLVPGKRLTLTGHALDRYNLAENPNEGVSERFTLDVVTPDQLLVSLEARELALRRRFEVIIEELSAMRDSLLRVKPSEKSSSQGSEPGEESENKQLTLEERVRRAAELRVLRVQRAMQQSKKSSQELHGVAQAFDGIRAELTNNRIDTEDRKSRLKEQVADPLHAIVTNDFVQLEELLLALEPLASDAERGPAAAEQAIVKSNDLLAKLDQILQKMLRLESFNEVVDLLRDLIREESALLDDTKRQQRRDLLDDE